MKLSSSILTKIALCAGITALLAWLIIPLPFSPVPLSGQTIGVMISGIVLPPGYAALSQIVYILLGIFGLPVFSGGTSGLGTLVGPTGGYIWGFVVGAYTISALVRYKGSKSTLGYVVTLTIGGVGVIYITGLAQLMNVTKMSFHQALLSGMLPFLLGDFFKVALVSSVAKRLKGIGDST